MPTDRLREALAALARVAAQLVAHERPTLRVVEIADGVAVLLNVSPLGERFPTLLAERAGQSAAELRLAPRTRDVLGAVRELRGAAPEGHLGPREIHAHLDRADPIGESTVGHALTELVRLGLLARSKEKGYELPRTTLPADAGSSAAG